LEHRWAAQKALSQGVKSALDSFQPKTQSLTFTAAFSSADSGKPSVRFDEGELEIKPSATTPALYSTEILKKQIFNCQRARQDRNGSAFFVYIFKIA